jgi:ribonucleoside-triphosphate reductase (thioredoxin)
VSTLSSYRPLLTERFIEGYPEHPEHMNALGMFVFYRTYSRFIPEEVRRENWRETCRRAVEYNANLARKHAQAEGILLDEAELKEEAEVFFDNMFNLRQFISGRTLWVGGAENSVAEKFPLANFNCAFTNITKWEDLGDLFYLLLVGTGVGFKCTQEMAQNLPGIRTNVELIHGDYKALPKAYRMENSDFYVADSTVFLHVGDSKEGWVEALRIYLRILTEEVYEGITTIKINYNSVRPKGERLKTFGGTASGHTSLLEMFQGFDRVLKNQIDPELAPIEVDSKGYGQVRPIHILDMGNLIGNNVVVGGVRRTAEIFLMDSDDWECIFAKYGVNGFWKEADFQKHEAFLRYMDDHGIKYPERFKALGIRNYDESVNVDFVTKQPRREADGTLCPYNFGTGFHHRAMSNNSIAFIDKPSLEFLDFLFVLQKTEGEPGFLNLYEAARRRLAPLGITNPTIIRNYAKLIGLNPCAEILLQSYGVCNLTTVNVRGFVVQRADGTYWLDFEKLKEAQRLSTRAGLRMTLVTLELPAWDEVQKMDRLIGPSMTGFWDAMDLIEADEPFVDMLLSELRKVVQEEAKRYATALRVPVPLLDTTVKPEGTQSQVAGGVSSGLHRSHSEYYIRRVRINADDSLAKAVLDLGWDVQPENGTPGDTYEEKMNNAKTYVLSFPVYSGATTTKFDVSVKEQFDTYFNFQNKYTSHNSSNTITVRDHEWVECRDIIFENWDNFVGVSFLALDGGTYQQAPYEAITKEQYEKMVAEMPAFDPSILSKYETAEDEEHELDASCDTGVCPPR